jgi:hypothetical protein
VNALVAYVDSLITNIGAEQDTLDALRKHFPTTKSSRSPCWQGTYVLIAAFLKSLQVPLDDGHIDWAAADAYMKKEGPDWQMI